MLHLLYALLKTARSSLRPQRELALENLALRQQLAIVQRKTKRPKLTQADRAFWVALCGLWPDWRNALIIVKPETVIRWHRKGLKLYWTWKSRHRGGRPRIDAEIRTLIARPQTARPFRATIGRATTFRCFEERQPPRALSAHWNTDALAFTRAEFVSDQIVTRAQGTLEHSRVLQGTGVRGRVPCL